MARKSKPDRREKDREEPQRRPRSFCIFCKGKFEPGYNDSEALTQFITDRGKIVPRERSGVCSKHQRRLSREIKRARHLAYLPFVA